MSFSDLVKAPGGAGRSALSDFLERTVIHEEAGAVVPWSLLRYGVASCAAIIALGLVGLAFSNPYTLGHGGFFLVLGSAETGVATLMHALAVPLILTGVAGLGLDAYLAKVPTAEPGRLAVGTQVGLAGLVWILGVLLLALIILNLALWIAIVAACLAVLGTLLMALGGG